MCGCNFKFLFPSSSKVSIVLKTSRFLFPTHLFAYSKISIVSLIPNHLLSSLKSKTGMVKVPSISKMTPSTCDLTFLPPQLVILKLLMELNVMAAAEVNNLETTSTKNMPCAYLHRYLIYKIFFSAKLTSFQSLMFLFTSNSIIK